MKKEKKRFQELNINNLVELFRHVGEVHIGPIMTAVHPVEKEESIHRLFDLAAVQREVVKGQIHKLKVEKFKLTNRVSLTGMTLNQVGELTAQIEALENMISDLNLKLNSLPKRNGITDNLFASPSTQDLIDLKLIKTDGIYTILTTRGEKVFKASNEAFDILKGMSGRWENPTDEQLLEMWAGIRKALKKKILL
jgi:hypothetical protein